MAVLHHRSPPPSGRNRPRGRWASVVALAACALAACSSTAASPPATATPTAQPSPTPRGPTTFRSPLYGYTITLPAGWTVDLPAAQRWDGSGSPGDDDPQNDVFSGPGRVLSWAASAPTTRTLAAYEAATFAASRAEHGCPDRDQQDPITIDGQPGLLLSWNCGLLINVALTVRNGTGYTFGFKNPDVPAATDPADRAAFETLLSSVKLP